MPSAYALPNSSALLPPVPMGQLVPHTTPGISTNYRPQRSVDFTKPAAMLSLLGSESRDVLGQGQDITASGQAALGPVIQYLMKLLSGDAAAIEEAILPEKMGVLAQYDSARRSIQEFSPRGGGQVSALAQGRLSEASDIATLRSTARRSAVGELSKLGLGQEEIGGRLAGQGMQGLDAVLRGALSEAQSKRQMWADLGVGIGSMAALIFAPYLAPVIAGGTTLGQVGTVARAGR